MDLYPFNLVLATAAAMATIFLGFLPTPPSSAPFFGRECLKAAAAWLGVALTSAPAICHWHFMIGLICLGAWWQFHRDRRLNGKLWLSVASGLGVSVGVMYILQTTPRAYPPGLPPGNQALLLASIYLGGAVIGLAYVLWVLAGTVAKPWAVAQELLRRYAGLLVGVTVGRALVMAMKMFVVWPIAPLRAIPFLILVLPVLAWSVSRLLNSPKPSEARYLLLFICLLGFHAELATQWLLSRAY